MKIIERIVNVETNETTDFEREATKEELAKVRALEIEMAKKETEAEENQIKKMALLEKLGITEDEAKLLLS